MACLPAQNPIKSKHHQQGIAIVEFAIGVILLLVVILVVAEAGRAFYSYNTLTKTVRNGARYVSVNALDTVGTVRLSNQLIDDTRNVIIFGGLPGGGAPVLPSMVPSEIDVVQAFPSGPANPYIEVTATYEYTPLFGSVPALGLGGQSHDFGFTMQARSTMRAVRGVTE